ncbi:MAG: DNA polymerase III subunit beta [Proteobacteria bacterium]|nr:DNA polymerase III subunit beta [Pseudomonadota bacterium]NDG26968.1 DNA polymerase III subunit beta [Pseudomonadota bacterium]
MKFIVSKTDMLLGLQRVQNVVERRTTMPILSNALLKAENSTLSLSATDLEVGIQSLLPATVKDSGAITVKARSLLDIVRELPETQISFQTKENSRLEITAKKSVFNIVGLPAEDFPEIPGFNSEEQVPFVRMDGRTIVKMLDKTLYAASTDEARYHLNGVYFETVEDKLKDQKAFRMVATDAHRLALVDSAEALFEESSWKMFQNGIIVPRKGLNELRRLLSEGVEDFFVSIKGKMLLLKREGLFLSMRLIEGKYADYRRIIPETMPHGIKVDKESFLASLKRISLMSSDKSRSLTFTLSPGILQLSSQSPELGDAQEEIAVDYQGEEMKIGFNSRYLIDAVSSIEGENVILELKGKQNPGVIRSCSGDNHTSVVMPMRI